MEGSDLELGLECVRAYNDWMIEDWCADSGGALDPAVHHPALGRGSRGRGGRPQRGPRRAGDLLQRDPDPPRSAEHSHGLLGPALRAVRGDAHGAVHAHRVVVEDAGRVARRAADTDIMLSFNNSMASLADFLFSGVLVRFPTLKLAYSEGQIGWIPYALERADNVWQYHSSWTGSKRTIPEPPSTYYTRPDLRLLHERHARHGEHRRGRRGQRLLRDRLSAHRHDLAVRARKKSNG